ncbi:Sugar kinase of the NBD/HSP70 family, may contain an N-terminal HTH domain [Geodermatophilus dictyosporus]|uniref:Sugar kinase of the NBD/HSP70 family, may contain an N-terminal HTH domain n=1 Tax=Geodermatophilus dictyosporus TaxID=1523247 RepID=A0A1I5U645_9ACTN|nr:ROK family protein [Geodermatophilus dictyosporus]SFP90763.1 Sugar kinase of the NBD/HSP70 family, may contain an N-terminal HTH domain [Geodermatophilus dictyosporus]
MASSSASAGALLHHVRTGRARSRAELVALTGAARNTVSARVDQLIAAGLLEESGRGWSTGGRPPTLLRFNSAAGCVLAVDLGVTSVDVAVTDLSAQVLATVGHPIDIAEGPHRVLAEVDRLAQEVLAEAGLTAADVCAVGVGVPGPVEFSTGRPSHPPIMPGWHDHPIPSAFGRYGCPVFVDNDVNVMALGEMGVAGSVQDVLVVKVGTGIGCGIIVDGGVYRGAQGSAGDIGHIHVPTADGREVVCRCGQVNCLEAIAGGTALLRDAQAAGMQVTTTREVVERAALGDGQALELVRGAGRTIGTVLAALVNFFNPHRIVMSGGVARAGVPLLAGIREAVYARSMPLAARALEITVSEAPDLTGRVGAALMAIEGWLDEDSVHQALARTTVAH